MGKFARDKKDYRQLHSGTIGEIRTEWERHREYLLAILDLLQLYPHLKKGSKKLLVERGVAKPLPAYNNLYEDTIVLTKQFSEHGSVEHMK